jgi:hypothetical protein
MNKKKCEIGNRPSLHFPLPISYFPPLALTILLFFASCRDEVVLNRPEDYADWNHSTNTWSLLFEGFWTGMNNNYVFWDRDPTDWDAVHREYGPRFAALDTAAGGFSAQKETAWEYFREMTANLVDGHYSMSISGISLEINPSAERHFQNHGAPYYCFSEAELKERTEKMSKTELFAERDSSENIAFQTAVEATLKNGAASDGEYQTWSPIDGDDTAIAVGIRRSPGGGAILYLRFNHFNWQALYEDTGEGEESEKIAAAIAAQKALFRQVQDGRLEDGTPVRGAIFDVRGNGGGSVIDLSRLWGRLISGEHTFARVRTKLGDNRLDFSPWMDYKIYSPAGSKPIMAPLVLLVNEGSISCSEMSAMIFKSLPSGLVVGGRTWGGQGFLTDNRIMNAGSFTVGMGNVITVSKTPSGQVQALDGHVYEGIGIPPDIEVPFDYAALTDTDNPRDTRLEAAIKVIEGP